MRLFWLHLDVVDNNFRERLQLVTVLEIYCILRRGASPQLIYNTSLVYISSYIYISFPRLYIRLTDSDKSLTIYVIRTYTRTRLSFVKEFTSSWRSVVWAKFRLKKLYTFSKKPASLGIMEAKLRVPFKSLNTIVLWWSVWFPGPLIELLWCRETLDSRTALRLQIAVCHSWYGASDRSAHNLAVEIVNINIIHKCKNLCRNSIMIASEAKISSFYSHISLIVLKLFTFRHGRNFAIYCQLSYHNFRQKGKFHIFMFIG